MRSLPFLLAAVLLAGCQASPTLERLRGDAPAPEPVFLERSAVVNATHEAAWPVEVGERASALNVTLRLETRALPGFLGPPARLDVSVLTPSGQALHAGTVDATHPTFTFRTEELAERGQYVVHVRGQGFSESLQGQGYGASYVLTMEVPQA